MSLFLKLENSASETILDDRFDGPAGLRLTYAVNSIHRLALGGWRNEQRPLTADFPKS